MANQDILQLTENTSPASEDMFIAVDDPSGTPVDKKVKLEHVMVPSGLISMWSGAIADIPSGWVLCDGNNGTPNLQNRFIVGAGDSYAVDATGGSSTVNLSHSHTVSSHRHQVNSHSHTVSSHTHGSGSYYAMLESKYDRFYVRLKSTPEWTANDKLAEVGTDGTDISSTRGMEIGGSSSSSSPGTSSSSPYTNYQSPGTDSKLSSSQENRPPYYALAFIMKT